MFLFGQLVRNKAESFVKITPKDEVPYLMSVRPSSPNPDSSLDQNK